MMLSVNQFAIQVGQADRLTKEATKPYREAYRKATPEQRAQLERDWITGYLEGNLKVTPKQAMAIFNTSRTERSQTQQESYKRGYAKFLDHVKSEVKNEEAPASNARTEKPAINPFARAVKKFKTKQQALKAFEEAWSNR